MKSKPIYVELPVQANMDELWEATQTPEHHEQWDLRFSSIYYLPKEEDEPQRFTYRTNIGFGYGIEGFGESIGSHNGKDGSKTSSLRFGTDQKASLIKEGRGYWKYNPQHNDTITFLTQYDYQVNFGAIGLLIDKLIFRPMIGWATALSFDVLKRWLEKGEKPSSQYIRFFTSWIISILFFIVWFTHGLIPKIIYQHPEELAMTEKLVGAGSVETVVFAIGIGEILFSFFWLLPIQKRWLYLLQLFAFPVLTVGAIVADPAVLTHPFSPLTFNLSLFVLSIIGLLVSRDTPTASSCKRKR
ncbi:DoxX-like family protein [Guptibacillus algicola]|uniref:DoxX-like family protein n=1 Tax=Guptibacillus algicola TaxID=225844 RepID=UPI001CD2EB35|nr:DoxX-like family protein [Alkalihalobacillus algicola]MCA0987388.1 DoxX-like family protein [Alkalihalobacillus algicola]